jgi:hypothetical protein
VYGHVVAGDPFGDIFVVPFADTLEDIKCAVGAKAVTLPSDIDVFAHISRDLSQIIPAGANSTSENQQASGKECPSPALCLQTPTSSPPTTPTMKPLEIFSGVYLPRTGSPPPSSNRTRMKCGLPTPETSPQTGSERITRRRSLHDKQTQLGTAFPR